MKHDPTSYSALYPIIDLEIVDCSLESLLTKLSEAGASLVQLRGKKSSSKDLLKLSTQMVNMTQDHSLKVIVNDRVDIAWLSKADGVHLGQDDLPCSDARQILGSKAIIGLSTHTLKQACQAEDSTADYIAIGPIYRTQTKENPDPIVSLDELKAIRKAVTKPLIAIGGITTKNALPLFDLGVDSVAVVRDIVLSENVHQQVSNYSKLRDGS